MSAKIITGAQAIQEALDEEMERDSSIFIFGEDVGSLGGRRGATTGLFKKYGHRRVIDTPINEELFLGIAIGAAQTGLRPVVEFGHGTFVTIDLNNIRRAGIWDWVSGFKLKTPILIRVKWGSDGLGHELSSSPLSSILNHLGLTIVAPSNPRQLKGLIKYALRGDKPVIILEHGDLYEKKGEVPRDDCVFPVGSAEYRRRGDHISVVAYSLYVDIVEEAANSLLKDGIDVEILDLISLDPLDQKKILETSRKNKKVLIIDEEPGGGALAMKLYATIKQEYPETVVSWLSPLATPLPFGPFGKTVIKKDQLVLAIKKLLKKPAKAD